MRYIRRVKNRRALLLVSVIATALAAVAFLPLERILTDVQAWVRDHEEMAFLAVTAFIAAGFLLSLPSSVLTMTAGFLFGLGQGFASAWIATLIASTLAFWITRSSARHWFERKIRRKAIFTAINRAIRRKGFLVVVLTRLVMILPYPALNYMLGLTRVRFRDFLAGTLIGMIPPILLFVFLGTAAGDIAAITRGDIVLEDRQLTVLVLVAVSVLLVAGVMIRKAGKVLKEELMQSEADLPAD